jgi:hypothetical protein
MRLQRQSASEYWLIAQSVHAALSGALAQRFQSPLLPPVSPEVAQAIAVHDAGWGSREQDAGRLVITLVSDGKPASFLDASPAEFIEAWTGSIEHAAAVSPLGGLMVSRHFSRLCEHRLNTQTDAPQETALLRAFLQDQCRNQELLLSATGKSVAGHGEATASEGVSGNSQIESLVDLLQFCDLLSLYLCAGAAEPAEFPQQFRGKTIRIVPERGAYRLEPSLFSANEALAKTWAGTSFSVPATRFPLQGKKSKPEMLSFTVQ